MILIKFLRDESGATAIEYSIIAALVSITLVGGATTIGTSLGTTFDDAADSM